VSTPFEWLIRSGYLSTCVARERVGHSLGRDPARAGNEIAALDVRADAGECAVNMNEDFRRFPPPHIVFYLVCSVGLLADVGVVFLNLCAATDLVGRRRRVDGRCLELRHVRTVRLAQAMEPSPADSISLNSTWKTG
jgi:hypothetical protein